MKGIQEQEGKRKDKVLLVILLVMLSALTVLFYPIKLIEIENSSDDFIYIGSSKGAIGEEFDDKEFRRSLRPHTKIGKNEEYIEKYRIYDLIKNKNQINITWENNKKGRLKESSAENYFLFINSKDFHKLNSEVKFSVQDKACFIKINISSVKQYKVSNNKNKYCLINIMPVSFKFK